MNRLVAVFRGYLPTGTSSIRLLVCLLLGVASLHAAAERVPPGTDAEISDRLEPIGRLCLEGDDCGQTVAAAGTEFSGGARSGEQIYNTSCTACHAKGVGGAPKLGNADDWAPRIDQGMETLWSHTLNGFKVMPPRGTCMDCSDEELRAAMDYMLESL